MTRDRHRVRQQAIGDTVTRALAAHHDAAVLTSPHVGAALAVHRAAPGLSLVGLLELAARSGPARRALEHARGCAHCGIGHLCQTGERLARTIKSSPARTRGWLALRSAAIAEAEARKREGAA